MSIMNEAMAKEDWEKMDRGENISRPKTASKPEPAFPKVPDLIKFDDIPLMDFEKIINASMKRVRNEEKVNFIGYDMIIKLRNKVIKGWMIEGDYEKLRRQR
jgi:hypothetical protein